jgi:hypothetical protein
MYISWSPHGIRVRFHPKCRVQSHLKNLLLNLKNHYYFNYLQQMRQVQNRLIINEMKPCREGVRAAAAPLHPHRPSPGCPLIGSPPFRVVGGVHPAAAVTAVGDGVPPAAVVVAVWCPLSASLVMVVWCPHDRPRRCECPAGHHHGHVVFAGGRCGSVVPPGRCRGHGCLQVIITAVWCPPGRPRGSVLPPRLSSWPCGARPVVIVDLVPSRSFSRPWEPPRSSSCGALVVIIELVPPPLVLVVVGDSCSFSRPWCPLAGHRGRGCLLTHTLVVWAPLVVVAVPSQSSSWCPGCHCRRWCPPARPRCPTRPHGCWCPPAILIGVGAPPPPRSLFWLCGVPPGSSSWPCGAPLVVLVAVGSSHSFSRPWCPLAHPCGRGCLLAVVWCPPGRCAPPVVLVVPRSSSSP